MNEIPLTSNYYVYRRWRLVDGAKASIVCLVNYARIIEIASGFGRCSSMFVVRLFFARLKLERRER